MDITDLVDSLRQDLGRAAEVGGEEARAAAERLLLAIDPALRLTLMDALSQAATEIGAQLPGVSVGVRLQGREPVFVVDGAPAPLPSEEPGFDDGAATVGEGEENLARITLRLPEALKTKAEALAARRGWSLNTWLVAAAKSAAYEGHGGGGSSSYAYDHRSRAGRHIKGWAK
jgi:hypothetical protein